MASTFENNARLILSDGHGIYIPQLFCDGFDAADAARINVDFKDVEICQAGPDEEWYWEAWQSILDSCSFTDADGKVWRLWQDGDLWEIPDDCEIPDFF